jgi:hypothetical protein
MRIQGFTIGTADINRRAAVVLAIAMSVLDSILIKPCQIDVFMLYVN